ncbi:hypothetical protein [Nocardiopsis suaedae]|uniref:DUF3592 domain-containing protein n=1 Tax=Nocardiopsis suaedae TaxID=3018444 RepID=A0ABT4TJQ4_9ACTN|nr:hypothetical protein [Nocardiopsis suaedae]MDA2804933.1 hypothetical protein [Nocardiopsis suaedae]
MFSSSLLLAMVLVFLGWMLAAFVIHESGRPIEFLGPGTVFGGIFIAIWIMGIHSKVALTKSSVKITNVFKEVEIPWGEIVSASDPTTRQFRIEVRNGTCYESLQYGGSFIGEIFKYPTHRRAVERVECFCEYEKNGNEGIVERVNLPLYWLASLVFIAYSPIWFLYLPAS